MCAGGTKVPPRAIQIPCPQATAFTRFGCVWPPCYLSCEPLRPPSRQLPPQLPGVEGGVCGEKEGSLRAIQITRPQATGFARFGCVWPPCYLSCEPLRSSSRQLPPQLPGVEGGVRGEGRFPPGNSNHPPAGDRFCQVWVCVAPLLFELRAPQIFVPATTPATARSGGGCVRGERRFPLRHFNP